MGGVGLAAMIFDWGGTLTPWHDVDVRAHWVSTAAVIDPPRAEELGEALLAAEAELHRGWREGQVSFSLADVFAAAGVTATEAALAAHFQAWSPHTITDEQAPAVLAGLRARGLRTGVLSNTTWSRQWHEEVFRRDGVLDLLDGAAYSSELPWTKPHPEAFRAAMRAVGVTDPARCVFVGDRLFDDVHGAKSAGMRAVLVPHSRIPPDQLVETGAEPDAVVEQLTDLLPLVDRWLAA